MFPSFILRKSVLLIAVLVISITVFVAESENKVSARLLPDSATVGDMPIGVSTTSRQAVLSYVAPDVTPCLVEVSPSSSYQPLVSDVDAVLYAGANLDSRSGSLGVGTTTRMFVVGTLPDLRGVINNLALDGSRY